MACIHLFLSEPYKWRQHCQHGKNRFCALPGWKQQILVFTGKRLKCPMDSQIAHQGEEGCVYCKTKCCFPNGSFLVLQHQFCSMKGAPSVERLAVNCGLGPKRQKMRNGGPWAAQRPDIFSASQLLLVCINSDLYSYSLGGHSIKPLVFWVFPHHLVTYASVSQLLPSILLSYLIIVVKTLLLPVVYPKI